MIPRVKYTSCVLCASQDIENAFVTQDYSISQEPYEIWSCKSCGFHFTQDVPDQEHIAPYYKSNDYISHSDTKKGLVNLLYHRVRNIMLARKHKLLKKLVTQGKVLDYGSGTGYFPAYLKSRGMDVDAIEIDPEARKFAKEKFGLNVMEPSVLLDQQLQPNSYQAITLWHVLEHLYDPKRYLARFTELLQDKGHLVIAVPNHRSVDSQHYKKYWAALDVPRHLWHFDPKVMEHLGTEFGLNLVHKEAMPFDSFYVSVLSEQYKRQANSGVLTAFWNGFKSYSKSKRNVDTGSSIIYVYQKM